MDIRGHGETPRAGRITSVGAIGGDVLALVRTLDGGPATLIGTSMAAGACVWAATEAPDRVTGLVLIDPFLRRGESSGPSRLLVSMLFARPWGPAVWLQYYAHLIPPASRSTSRNTAPRCRPTCSSRTRLEALRAMLVASKAALRRRGAYSAFPPPGTGAHGQPGPGLPGPRGPGRVGGEPRARQLSNDPRRRTLPGTPKCRKPPAP